MNLGLITDSVGHLPFESALDLAKEQGLSSVEVATGNWSEAPHADLATLLSTDELHVPNAAVGVGETRHE